MNDRDIQYGNEGKRLVPGETENLSSSNHQKGDAALPEAKVGGETDLTDGTRGERASFDPKTGAVHGSGANAGGGGRPGEDHDQDSAGGGTKAPVPPAGAGR